MPTTSALRDDIQDSVPICVKGRDGCGILALALALTVVASKDATALTA